MCMLNYVMCAKNGGCIMAQIIDRPLWSNSIPMQFTLNLRHCVHCSSVFFDHCDMDTNCLHLITL